MITTEISGTDEQPRYSASPVQARSLTSVPEPTMQDASRIWGRGWRRYFFPAFWLVYLGQAVSGVSKHSHGSAALAGYAIVVAFAASYLIALTLGRNGLDRWFWSVFVIGAALTGAECLFARQDALVFLVYLSVLAVANRSRFTAIAVVGMTLAAAGVPRFVPGWGGAVDWDLGLSVLLASIAVFGFFRIVHSNIELSAARAEVARLAAENERSRIARDLHDLLGHSLTTITVKACLARRLGERGETGRALAEITEVEKLSRRTLGDVRAAVSAHRDVTLAGELATAREVLRAAGIVADLPPTVAETDSDVSELFGWIVREGVTNVVRHSRARHARIALGRRTLSISDDGRGAQSCASGNGLVGLRERTEAVGGTLSISSTMTGFVLHAEVPAPGRPDVGSPPER